VSPQIEVISGVRSWRIALEGDRSTVGRGEDNDVPVPDDTTASNLHAVLEHFTAGWCVTDLGSSNGTWVNGRRVLEEVQVRPGDRVSFGGVTYRLAPPPGS
jgi:pSer/pThr/pTyr-binding forkhead associated (FHA) protein